MARTSSAKKAKRASEKRRVFNTRRKKAMKDSAKDLAKLLSAKKASEAAVLLPQVQKALDKAAKNGVIKKSTAARIKSRIAKRLRALSA